jgi:secreted trypsin-like serine protease
LNDIAILKLKNQVDLNSKVQIACLPTNKSNSYPGTNVDSIAAGWGNLEFEGSSPNILNEVDLKIYESSYCSRVLKGLDKNWDSQICAGDMEGFKDTCQGDSGIKLLLNKHIYFIFYI